MDVELLMGGALRSPDDYSDFVYEFIACTPSDGTAKELPKKFDLRKFNVSIKNQGTRFTCGSLVGSGMHEINKRRVGYETEEFSSDFIYFHRVNKPQNGMFARNVMEILQRYGTLPENQLPYARTDGEMVKPSYEHYKLAENNRIDSFARIFTIEGIKKALVDQGAVYLGLPLYNAGKLFWRPATPDAKAIGGHAVLIIGYKNKGFIFKNSWGVEWGRKGYGIFPFSDFSLIWEAFVSINQPTPEPETDSDTDKKRRMSLPAELTPRSLAFIKQAEDLTVLERARNC